MMEAMDTRLGADEADAAFRTIRCAKNFFWWLLVLGILAQLAAFVLVRFAGVIDLGEPAPTAVAPAAGAAPGVGAAPVPATGRRPVIAPAGAAKAPASQPASAPAGAEASDNTWDRLLGWVLPGTRFAALLLGTLLALTLLVAAKLALAARAAGVAAFLSAFFWSLLLWVILIPWQQALRASVACGALFNLTELTSQTRQATAPDASLLTTCLYYARFAAYPALALLLAVIVQVKFARGFRRASQAGLPDVTPVGEKM